MQDSVNSNRRANGRWTHEQHLIFLQGLRVYGKNWKKIQQLIQTRTGTQIRSHAQKFFIKIDHNETRSKEMPHDDQDSQTENSKMGNSTDEIRENSSYFLNKILEHSTGYGVADFWTALIDCKQQADTKEYKPAKLSFEYYTKALEGQINLSHSI